MLNHYRKLRFLPLFFFCALTVCAGLTLPIAQASDLAPILPQFVPDNPPHGMVDLAFHDAQGAPHKLSDYHGQLVLVNLWATWCVPCRRELPSLDRLQRVFRKTKFIILPLSMDDKNDGDKIAKFYKDADIRSLSIFKDLDFGLLKQLHPDGLPMSYLIMPDGNVVGHIEGYADWDGEEAANLIEAYLAKTSGSTGK